MQVTLTSQPTQATQMTQHPGVPMEVRLIVQALTGWSKACEEGGGIP